MSVLIVASMLAQIAVSESIVVTATRTGTRIAETPGSVVVVSKETLSTTAAPAVDDALRQVTGFTLFRRAGSRTANPTTQGVSLRGVGASGASRALVLDDGIPLNDPFGGWVYWGRIPRLALDRVEVLRGGASDLYGSSAMGGVIQFFRRQPPALAIDVSAGSEETATASVFAGMRRGLWNGSIAADLFTSGGYVTVRPDQRGAVDVESDSRHTTLDAAARHGEAFLRASYYQESRRNGTPLQKNDTTIFHLSMGADQKLGGGLLALRAYGSDQNYFQTFSAVAAKRASERLTVEQTVPSRGIGGSAQWTRSVRDRHVIVAGAELRGVRGTSEEMRFTPAGTFAVSAGGTQQTAAAYLEDIFVISPSVTVTSGIRADGWRNDGGNVRNDEVQINPRMSLLWRVSDLLVLSGSAYKAFRAPTLNELYRGFRVGNIDTLPNANLDAENLTGFEFGARAYNSRLTLFWMEMSDTISNVTIGSAGGSITRQRQNLGQTRSRGAELDTEWRFTPNWRLSGGWLFVEATVTGGELQGKRLPQVPEHQVTAQVTWRTISGQLRWSTSQFDDDRNELPLDGYLVADVFASHPLGRGLDLTLAVENVTGEAVEVSATPVVTLGQPRAWRMGLRYGR